MEGSKCFKLSSLEPQKRCVLTFLENSKQIYVPTPLPGQNTRSLMSQMKVWVSEVAQKHRIEEQLLPWTSTLQRKTFLPTYTVYFVTCQSGLSFGFTQDQIVQLRGLPWQQRQKKYKTKNHCLEDSVSPCIPCSSLMQEFNTTTKPAIILVILIPHGIDLILEIKRNSFWGLSGTVDGLFAIFFRMA